MPKYDLTIIPAKEKQLSINDNNKQYNVCCYCRVSTDKKDQLNSLESQKKFFTFEFDRHSNWNYNPKKDLFFDEGLSGTTDEKREGFNRMITSALSGKYNLIITKEVSRFYRNNRKLLDIVEKLRKANCHIYFLAEGINTEDPKDYEMFLQSATRAELESRTISKRVRWGQQRCMERGIVFGRKEMLGYRITRDESGEQKFVIVEEEAEIVERIFKMYDIGIGTFKIARQLEAEGIKSFRYSKGWSNTVILRILRNEKYVGDLLQGKTYTVDVLSHKKKYNRNDSVQYYIKDHHPNEAIISRDLWDKVQARLKANEPSDAAKSKHSNRYWCSGKVFCGVCGERYISNTKKQKSLDANGNNRYYKKWICWNNHQYGSKNENGCANNSVNDKILKQGVLDLMQIIMPDKENYIKLFKKGIEKANKVGSKTLVKSLDKLIAKKENIEIKLSKLLDDKYDGNISENLWKMKNAEYEKELLKIEADISEIENKNNEALLRLSECENRIAEIEQMLKSSSGTITDMMLSKIIDRIVVYPDKILEYYLFFSAVPFILKFNAYGKLENYKIEFTSLKENPYNNG